MSNSSYLVNAETRRQIMIQRLSGGVYRRLSPILNTMRRDLVSKLRDNPSDFQAIRMQRLLIEIDDIIKGRLDEFTGQMRIEMDEFLLAETTFQAKLLNRAVTVDVAVPTIEQMRAAVDNSALTLVSGQQVKRMTVPVLVREFSEAQSKAVRNAISAAVIQGSTVDEAARVVSSLVGNRTRAQARTLVRTSFNHAGSVARSETYNQNQDVLEGERFIATLDSRTTLQCGGHDQEVFPVGQGPIPPLHYGCRSVRVPVVKQEFRVMGLDGERPEVGADGRGVVSGTKTYDGWLRDQPADFQNEVLGEDRAKLFRKGVKVERFTDDEGKTIDLDQLEAMESILL